MKRRQDSPSRWRTNSFASAQPDSAPPQSILHSHSAPVTTVRASFSAGILRRVNHGYDELEPTLLALVAMRKTLLLIGPHGTGKTRVCEFLSRGIDPTSFQRYHGPLEDLTSIAGFPSAKAMNKGVFSFIQTGRSVFNKKSIMIDELTRAPRDAQNLFLELLEERSVFGIPCAYECLVCTANPDNENYAGSIKLDHALLDRFHAVLLVPSFQDGLSGDDVATMIQLANGSTLPDASELNHVYTVIRREHTALVEGGARDRIERFLVKLIPELISVLQRSDERYVSPRTFARNLPETILAVAAYYRGIGERDALRVGATDALRYALACKLQIKPVVLEQLHATFGDLLSDATAIVHSPAQLEIYATDSWEERLVLLESRWDAVCSTTSPDEQEKLVGTLVADARAKGVRERLVPLRGMLARVGYSGDALRQVDGPLIVVFRQSLNSLALYIRALGDADGADVQAAQTLSEARLLLADGSSAALLSDHSPEAVQLKRYLISASDGGATLELEPLSERLAAFKTAMAGRG